MAMSSSRPPSLHTLKASPLTPFNRILAFLHSVAILALFYLHLTSLPTSPSPLSSSLLLLSDAVLAFMSLLLHVFRWRPIDRRQCPDVLDRDSLPCLDVFICTADPWKEPPISVASTALSVLAYDYPAEKVSVYVSDDGGSELTLFAFMEAARFARHWLPFCRENMVQMRSPEAYFSSGNADGDHDGSGRKMKGSFGFFGSEFLTSRRALDPGIRTCASAAECDL